MSGPLTTFNTGIISKPFTPSQFSGLELWLRGDHGVIADSNGRVSEWRDYSGKQRHVTQATSGQQPLRVNAAKAGLPGVQFVSTRSDILESTTATGIDNCTIYTVFRLDNADSTEDLPISIGQGSGPFTRKCRFLYRGASATKIGFATWGNDFAGSATDYDTGNFHVIGALQSGTSVTIIKNSNTESITLSFAPETTTQDYWGIGGSSITGFGNYYTNCTIGEVIIYNRAVNITERQQILTYLRNKWQTPV